MLFNIMLILHSKYLLLILTECSSPLYLILDPNPTYPLSLTLQTKPSALHHQSSMRRHEYQSQQSQQWPNFQQSERLFNSQRHLNPRRDPQQASFRVRVRPRSIADMLDDSPQVN